ncbi:MAG: hypothetical protein K2L78_04115, partial [Muribaculaceae bacterium]|nr:hypothetical protein [Muribaculaceae bacterium]
IGAIAMVAAWFIFVPVPACAAAGANSYCSGSVLSAGRWVKIKVRQSGIYQITDRELRDMGFENPEDVAVYGYPAVMLASNRLTDELPDDVPAVPSARYGGKLVFYGEGDVMLSVSDMPWQGGLKPFVDVKRNYFADYGTYFLTDSHPRAVVGEKPYSGLSGSRGVVSVSHGMAHFEEEVQNPGETGARYLGADFLAGGGGEWRMGMPGFNGGGPVNVRLLSGIRLDAPGRMYVRLFDTPRSGHQIAPLSPSFYSYGIEEFGYSLEGVVPRADGIYPVRCQFSGSPRGMAALEYVTALYPRDNTLGGEPQGVFVFCDVARDGNVEFTGEGELPVVWNITRRDAPVALATEKTGEGKFGFTLHASPGGEAATGRREYVAVFDPAATLLQVECMGEVSCANLHGTPTPEMLVVASREFMPQAERLARLHRDAEGMDVAVVLQDDVYNEFSWGTPHLMAIRRVARMFHDRDAGKFRSILLFGPAHYDSRGLCAGDAEWFRNRYLPMFVCEDARIAGHFNRSYSTDAFVGMLEDDEGPFDIVGKLMTVAVGRIPALSAKEADDYLDKLERYVASPPDVACSTRAALICDAGDGNGHMYDADSLAEVIAGRSPWVTVFKAYNTLYPLEGNSATMLRRRLVSALKQGVCYLGYNGHGSPTRFGSEELWSVRMAEQTEYSSPPFAMLASCNSLLIDRPVRSTGAAMLFKNRGGAIAVAGSLREVFKADNRVLSLCVGDEFFNDGDALTLGEVFSRARNAVGGRVLATA